MELALTIHAVHQCQHLMRILSKLSGMVAMATRLSIDNKCNDDNDDDNVDYKLYDDYSVQ